jgi:hypothetical protein
MLLGIRGDGACEAINVTPDAGDDIPATLITAARELANDGTRRGGPDL